MLKRSILFVEKTIFYFNMSISRNIICSANKPSEFPPIPEKKHNLSFEEKKDLSTIIKNNFLPKCENKYSDEKISLLSDRLGQIIHEWKSFPKAELFISIFHDNLSLLQELNFKDKEAKTKAEKYLFLYFSKYLNQTYISKAIALEYKLDNLFSEISKANKEELKKLQLLKKINKRFCHKLTRSYKTSCTSFENLFIKTLPSLKKNESIIGTIKANCELLHILCGDNVCCYINRENEWIRDGGSIPIEKIVQNDTQKNLDPVKISDKIKKINHFLSSFFKNCPPSNAFNYLPKEKLSFAQDCFTKIEKYFTQYNLNAMRKLQSNVNLKPCDHIVYGRSSSKDLPKWSKGFLSYHLPYLFGKFIEDYSSIVEHYLEQLLIQIGANIETKHDLLQNYFYYYQQYHNSPSPKLVSGKKIKDKIRQCKKNIKSQEFTIIMLRSDNKKLLSEELKRLNYGNEIKDNMIFEKTLRENPELFITYMLQKATEQNKQPGRDFIKSEEFLPHLLNPGREILQHSMTDDDSISLLRQLFSSAISHNTLLTWHDLALFYLSHFSENFEKVSKSLKKPIKEDLAKYKGEKQEERKKELAHYLKEKLSTEIYLTLMLYYLNSLYINYHEPEQDKSFKVSFEDKEIKLTKTLSGLDKYLNMIDELEPKDNEKETEEIKVEESTTTPNEETKTNDNENSSLHSEIKILKNKKPDTKSKVLSKDEAEKSKKHKHLQALKEAIKNKEKLRKILRLANKLGLKTRQNSTSHKVFTDEQGKSFTISDHNRNEPLPQGTTKNILKQMENITI